MTPEEQKEQYALVGQLMHESKVADETLRHLLVKAESVSRELSALSDAISARVKLVRNPDESDNSGAAIGAPGIGAPSGRPSGDRIERLNEFAKVLDLRAIQDLDRQIDEAAARAGQLRYEKRQLGI